jgi:hypothetical protein
MAKAKGTEKSGGRVAGTPNKASGTVKAGVLDAFLRLKGSDGMIAWAQSSPQALGDFYKIAARLIPTEVVGADGGPLIVEIVKESNPK